MLNRSSCWYGEGVGVPKTARDRIKVGGLPIFPSLEPAIAPLPPMRVAPVYLRSTLVPKPSIKSRAVA